MTVGLLSCPLTYSYAAENDVSDPSSYATITDATEVPEVIEDKFLYDNGTSHEIEIIDDRYELTKATIDGVTSWYKFTDGKFDTTFTGFAENINGWWYVKDGALDKAKNGIVKGTINGAEKNYYVKNGNAKLTLTGFAKVGSDWRYIEKGIAVQKTGTINGTVNGTKGWYYVKSGKVDLTYRGFAKVGSSWMYFIKGMMDKTKNGTVSATIQGVKAWYLVTNGKLDNRNSAIAKVGSSYMLFSKGKLAKNFSGKVLYNSKIYTIKSGKVIKTEKDKNTCQHNWVWATKTVHHDAVTEEYLSGYREWDEAIYVDKVQCDHGKIFNTPEEILEDHRCGGYTHVDIFDHYVHHKDPLYDTRVVKEAYDEEVKDYQYCSKCGARKQD